MPLYEYACPACGKRAEKMRSISDRATGPECPSCGEGMVLGLSMPGRVSAGASSGSSLPRSSCGGSSGFT
ncbi:MAG: zinc ribbon domain-containing protein [Longimicrobiales bacterium]|nr:zinc ribbon domain-containing protein [Longimicrobiales bacterium]